MGFFSWIRALYLDEDAEAKHAELEVLALLREAKKNLRIVHTIISFTKTIYESSESLPKAESNLNRARELSQAAAKLLDLAREYASEITEQAKNVQRELSSLRGKAEVSKKSFSIEERNVFQAMINLDTLLKLTNQNLSKQVAKNRIPDKLAIAKIIDDIANLEDKTKKFITIISLLPRLRRRKR